MSKTVVIKQLKKKIQYYVNNNLNRKIKLKNYIKVH